MLIRPIDVLLPRASTAFGGKARNLAALVRGGFPVPAAFAISCEAAEQAYRRSLPAELHPDRLLARPQISEEVLDEVRERILSIPLGNELESELRQALGALLRASVGSVAVRSSSLSEDQGAASAAGLHASILHVRTEQELFDAVRRCWASVLTPSVAGYREALGVEGAASMGVVIQAMVPADAAGVLFTVNPLTGDDSEMVINACYGLGTGVTDGRLTPDTYRIDKHSGWIRDRVLGDKRLRCHAEGGALVEEEVDEALARKQALDEHQLEQIVSLGRRIEEHFGDARDVEFAVAGDAVYVLQARPVTAAAARSTKASRGKKSKRLGGDPRNLVWSSVNVGEALPGVATPLTWSVLSAFSDLGFRQAFAALGCKVPRDAVLVGNFRGRIYLNLTELTAIASQVPGLRPTTVLPLGGAAEAARLEREAPRVGRAGFLLRLPATATRFAQSNLGFRRKVERFETRFVAERTRIERLDLRILPAAALDETLSDVRTLLDETGALMLTAYGGLLSALVPLRAALRLLVSGDRERVLSALLMTIDDVESADPGVELLNVAEAFAHDRAARENLLGGADALDQIPPGGASGALKRFLSRYGHRGVREAELSEPRWREQPQLLFDALRVQLAHDGAHGERLLQRVADARAERERALTALPVASRPAIAALLAVVHHYMRLRERLRSHVVHVLGLFRVVALDTSRRLTVREPGVAEDAAFFLTLEELHAVLRGHQRSVAALVGLRQAQFERDRSLPDPPETFVGYPPPVAPPAESGVTLQGIGASTGATEAVARVLRSPQDISQFQPGEVLVVEAADVGWAPVFALAGALVTEHGGPLSHACVVAREYGLPTVVAVPGVMGQVSTGERLRVDGDAGTVERLSLGGRGG